MALMISSKCIISSDIPMVVRLGYRPLAAPSEVSVKSTNIPSPISLYEAKGSELYLEGFARDMG